MNVFSSKRSRRRAVIVSVLLTVAFVSLYVAARRYAPFLFDAEELRVWVDQFGVLAPLVFVLLQTGQVVLAPIPGQVVALVAGYLFGPLAGTVYSLVGVLLGSAIAFTLAERYGRSFVEDMLHDDVIDRFDTFVDQIGIPGLVAFVVIPGLPDDAICFLAGITKWRLRTFMAAIAVGRLPAYVLTVYAGGKLASGRFAQGLALIGAIVALSAVGYYKQESIRETVRELKSQLSG
jgi:uncharacterized membrane protein YdjX (TVP38/TMEM64 family)